MKTAFSIWEQRIAPVLDTARHLSVVESEEKRLVKEHRHTVQGNHPSQFVTWLCTQGVETLVCGAVSRPFQEQLEAAGIQMIPFVTGELQTVIAAYLDGKLEQETFRMPGCCGRRKRICGVRRYHGGCNTFKQGCPFRTNNSGTTQPFRGAPRFSTLGETKKRGILCLEEMEKDPMEWGR